MTDALSANSHVLTPQRWMSRPREFAVQHPVLTVAILAFAVRMITAITLTLLGIDDLVSDDRTYIALVRSKLNGTLDEQDLYFQELYSSVWVFIEPLTIVSRVFGTHVLVGQVVIAMWGALTAAVTTTIALRLFSSRRIALLTGFVPALLPSQILWSSVWLKDATVSACLALVVLGLIVAGRGPSRREQLMGIATVGAGLLGLSGTRLNSFVMACWCLAIAIAVLYLRRPSMLALAVMIAVIIPWIGSAGLLGGEMWSRAETLGSQRAASAVSADSALVEAAPLGSDPSSATGNLKHLPKGLVAVLFRPLPWEGSTSNAATFAKFDNLIWYGIAALAILGLWTARRHRDYLLVILLIAATVGVYALAEGNLGTAYRHRGEVVWGAALLAGLFLDQRLRHRGDSVSSDG